MSDNPPLTYAQRHYRDNRDIYIQRVKDWRANNKERHNAWNAEWREKNKDEIKRARALRRYGITPEKYDEILAGQDGVCALCRAKSSAEKKEQALCVDHCHRTGQIRGLLCHSCNMSLRKDRDTEEFLERAIFYLRGEHLDYWRGYETAIAACVIILEHRQQKTGREMVSAMRDLIIQNVPRAE